MEAARLRFRPILMMSLAFTLGVVPLAIATGASAGSQNAIGTGVMGGMISATILAVFFVPGFFVFVMKLFGRGNAGAARARVQCRSRRSEAARKAAGDDARRSCPKRSYL